MAARSQRRYWIGLYPATGLGQQLVDAGVVSTEHSGPEIAAAAIRAKEAGRVFEEAYVQYLNEHQITADKPLTDEINDAATAFTRKAKAHFYADGRSAGETTADGVGPVSEAVAEPASKPDPGSGVPGKSYTSSTYRHSNFLVKPGGVSFKVWLHASPARRAALVAGTQSSSQGPTGTVASTGGMRRQPLAIIAGSLGQSFKAYGLGEEIDVDTITQQDRRGAVMQAASAVDYRPQQQSTEDGEGLEPDPDASTPVGPDSPLAEEAANGPEWNGPRVPLQTLAMDTNISLTAPYRKRLSTITRTGASQRSLPV